MKQNTTKFNVQDNAKDNVKSTAQSISALILAGGQSQRFNYIDKGLIPFLQKPMIEHVLERIAPQVTYVSISCNRHTEQYRSIIQNYYQVSHQVSHQVNQKEAAQASAAPPICISDKTNDPLQGPLAGVSAYLEHCHSDTIFICSTDMPLIDRNIVQQLSNAMHQFNADACYPVDENGHHYLAVLIKRSAATNALQQLLASSATTSMKTAKKTKVYAIKNWLNQIKSHQILIDSHAIGFADINNAADMTLIEDKVEQKLNVKADF